MLFIQWTAIFIAALLALFGNNSTRVLSFCFLLAGYGIAIATHQIGISAIIVIILLIISAGAIFTHNRHWQYTGHALFILLAIALATHSLPDFQNYNVFNAIRFTPNAVPFTMYLNLDKPLIGFWLLLAVSGIHAWRGLRQLMNATVIGLVATTCVCMTLAYALGKVIWEPKLPTLSWLWILNNFLLVSVTEEAFFRGYVQSNISRLLKHTPSKDVWAISIAAILFGMTHLAGGWQWAMLAGIAGIGYGIAYRYGGLLSATLTHFGLNAVHFFLFTYPMTNNIRY